MCQILEYCGSIAIHIINDSYKVMLDKIDHGVQIISDWCSEYKKVPDAYYGFDPVSIQYMKYPYTYTVSVWQIIMRVLLRLRYIVVHGSIHM